jgi:hypothetical protein
MRRVVTAISVVVQSISALTSATKTEEADHKKHQSGHGRLADIVGIHFATGKASNSQRNKRGRKYDPMEACFVNDFLVWS